MFIFYFVVQSGFLSFSLLKDFKASPSECFSNLTLDIMGKLWQILDFAELFSTHKRIVSSA